MTTFPFSDIPSAFTYMRGGTHIGKIVITDEGADAGCVAIRRAPRKVMLKEDASYLLVGGLKGLCGSLAVALAQHGACHLVVMSRSGIADAKSCAIVQDCVSHGCTVYEICGDVADKQSVELAFSRAPFPIRGVVNGAMVLRVSQMSKCSKTKLTAFRTSLLRI